MPSQTEKVELETYFLRRNKEEEENIEGEVDSPEEIVLERERDQGLVEAIQELDYKYREAIILYYFNEMSIEEISFQIRENSNTIKSRLARGRKQLRSKLEGRGSE